MAGFGFRRDIANSRLDIEVAGTDAAQLTSSAFNVPSGINFQLAGTTVSASAAQLNALRTGFIPLDLFAMRLISSNAIPNIAETQGTGGLLAATTDPILQRVNGATDKAARVNWDGTSVIEAQFPPIPLPPDIDTSANVEVHLLTAVEAATTATLTIDVQAFNGVGDTEMGGAATLDTSTTSVAEQTVALAAANIAAEPGFINLALVPGAHSGGADIFLYAAWIEYTVG